jgi:hypothetical protein
MTLFILSQASIGWRQAQFLKREAEAEARAREQEIHLPEKKTVL